MSKKSSADKHKLTPKEVWREMVRNKDCYVYLFPFFSLFFLFTILPVLVSIVLSFTYFNTVQIPRFIGLTNYINLFINDDTFLLAVKNTIVISVFAGPLGYFMSFFFAWVISELPPKLRAVMVTVLYAPSISGAAYLVWTVMFSGDAISNPVTARASSSVPLFV